MDTTIAAPPAVVWDDVRRLDSHVEWMGDAEAIRFTSERHAGVGTTFDCDTRVGPLRLVDRMAVTEWEDGRVIGVRHVGLVTGTGRFSLEPAAGGTRFTWDEELTIPWWLGGPLAAPVLRLVWVRNLRRLRRRFEGPTPGSAVS